MMLVIYVIIRKKSIQCIVFKTRYHISIIIFLYSWFNNLNCLKANFYVYLKSVYTVDSLVNMEERDTIRLSCER